MSDDWTDEEFLGYVDIHCDTERALFSAAHVKRLHGLAGEDLQLDGRRFYAMHRDYAGPLIQRAREAASLRAFVENRWRVDDVEMKP